MVGKPDAVNLVVPWSNLCHLVCQLIRHINIVNLIVLYAPFVICERNVACYIPDAFILVAEGDDIAGRQSVEVAHKHNRQLVSRLEVVDIIDSRLHAFHTCLFGDMVEMDVEKAEDKTALTVSELGVNADSRAHALVFVTGAWHERCRAEPYSFKTEKLKAVLSDGGEQTFFVIVCASELSHDDVIGQHLFQHIKDRLCHLLKSDDVRLFFLNLVENKAGSVNETVDAVGVELASYINVVIFILILRKSLTMILL